MTREPDGAALVYHLRGAMVGAGMIFDETYRPFFERTAWPGLLCECGLVCPIQLVGIASRTGKRASAYKQSSGKNFGIFAEPNAVEKMLAETDPHFVCIATPDDRHFEAAKIALSAGKHVIIEKPSVLSVAELDELVALAEKNNVLAKVVYHKLLDPDHKKLYTLVHDGVLQHVNNGYCSLLEPKSIATSQFSEWIQGRNPGTYVAVHWIKLIDFVFGGKLKHVSCTGQRGIVGSPLGDTWDSTQLRLIYELGDGREAAFDIHTSWVHPDNFPGHVEQEVQFRFDNGVWNAHSRRRGVECVVEDDPKRKLHLNNHFTADFLEPWGQRDQRGYGVEVLERFAQEVAYVEFGDSYDQRGNRLHQMRSLRYNDLSADRQVVAAVEAMERILRELAEGG